MSADDEPSWDFIETLSSQQLMDELLSRFRDCVILYGTDEGTVAHYTDAPRYITEMLCDECLSQVSGLSLVELIDDDEDDDDYAE